MALWLQETLRAFSLVQQDDYIVQKDKGEVRAGGQLQHIILREVYMCKRKKEHASSRYYPFPLLPLSPWSELPGNQIFTHVSVCYAFPD